jgi:hypothetical protein
MLANTGDGEEFLASGMVLDSIWLSSTCAASFEPFEQLFVIEGLCRPHGVAVCWIIQVVF